MHVLVCNTDAHACVDQGHVSVLTQTYVGVSVSVTWCRCVNTAVCGRVSVVCRCQCHDNVSSLLQPVSGLDGSTQDKVWPQDSLVGDCVQTYHVTHQPPYPK